MLENKSVHTSVYYKSRNRLDASAIMISRKTLRRPRMNRASFVKKVRVRCSATVEGPLSAAVKVYNKDGIMDIVLYDAKGPVAGTDTTTLESTS